MSDIGERYASHAGSYPGAAPRPKQTLRCLSTSPDNGTVQCIHLASTPHRVHSGWRGDTRCEWQDPPRGPQLEDEWRAIAWSFTDGLGIDIVYDIGDVCLRVDHHSMATWWDKQEPEWREELLTNYRASRTKEK